MSEPGPVWHVVLVDDEPGPGGWGARCVPHGDIGRWPERVLAFLHALEHDIEQGGRAAG